MIENENNASTIPRGANQSPNASPFSPIRAAFQNRPRKLGVESVGGGRRVSIEVWGVSFYSIPHAHGEQARRAW